MRLPVLFLLTCAAWAQPARFEFKQLPQPVMQQRLESLSRKPAERRATLEALFREAGCDGVNLKEQPVPGSKQPNIICTLPGAGPDAPVIVVGGHYDLVETGEGAVDDWSGAVLLPSLYESLKNAPRAHTYTFVAFAAEEVGLHGSREYVKRLSKEEKAGVHAMINLECLGLGPPRVWVSRADKTLLADYARVAQALGMDAKAGNVDNLGDDDSHPFLNEGIPVLTIHSVTRENFGILHTSRDRVRAIHPGDYYAAYRMAAAFVAYLDGPAE